MARNHTKPAPADAAATALPAETTPAPSPESAPQLIVAIGASAGGLEAYKRFFSQMPTDSGMAFVLVQHLAPDSHSMLAELIGRSTHMEVVQAADGDPVEPGHVYVIPPDATLTIESGILQVQTPAPPRQHRWPIDTFFCSLAEDQGDNAVCVVLSGSGSDGARGLRTVKEYGGLTVAQASEDHTPMSGMPASAAATGLVDHVLPVEQIPALLIAHLAHLRATRSRKAPDGIRQDLPAHVQTITNLLRAEVGHDFGQYKEKTLVRRIQRRMQVLQMDAVKDYIARLRKDPVEIEALFRDLLIGVTEFFRDPAAFEALKTKALPALLAEKGAADTLRVWVPGCSTGEEAYSMAIAICEVIGDRRSAPKVQIFATDIDDRAIATARAGRYTGPLVGLTPERESRWFTTDGDDRCVSKGIREMCVFSVHSAIKDPPFSQLDVISCRNLLIYLNAELQQRLLRVFHYALRPGGFLLLGPSESLARSATLFTVLDKKQRLYQRRNDVIPNGIPIFRSPAGIAHPGTAATRSAAARSRAQVDDSLDRGVRRALEKYSPAYVVIDGNHDIVRFSGNTARYLGPSTGNASLNLFTLLHKGLRSAARTLVQQAASQQRPVVQEGLDIDVEGQRQTLRLIAAPLHEADGGKDLSVLAFADIERVAAGTQPGGPDKDSARITDLEQQLEQTRQQLQAAIEQQETANEELMSANEEYQSVNEELQSANEELETSKEEMQSINEELQTINAELQSKNETLARLNNDLRNLMESTQIATLFLDTALHVTGFTSGMGQVFHLREGDRGRPITEIATRVHYPQLQDDVQQVLRTLASVERVLHSGHGVPTYLLRVRPYRTVDNVIDGAVLTFIDITEREEQEAERARLAAIVEWSKDAIIGYALDGTITSWNAGAERVLGYQPKTVVGHSLAMLLPAGQEDQFRRLLAACADPEGVTKFEATWRRQNGSTVAIDLSCSPVKDDAGKVVSGSAIARDVTDRRRADRALHDSEFRLTAILEQTSMGLAQTDVEGRFELVNPRFCEIVGRTARELYRLRVQDILHPDDVQQSLDLVRTLLSERSHFQLDLRFVRPDGSIVWTSNSVTAMLGGDPAPQHIISAVLDISEQKLASQHVDLMLDELNHRVKNTLATVQAIAMQTLKQSTSMDAFRTAFGARLLALSKTHNLLAHDAWTGAQLRDIVASELAPYLRDGDAQEQARAHLAGGDLMLNPKMALALSMAMHELATNASKYGALSGSQGEVTVRWHARDEDGEPWLHLAWIESGGPQVTPPSRRGFGTRLITEGLAFELNGEATLDYVETGVSCVIHVPLSKAAP
jgi:two-component system CheB/CheR fusion protein